MKKWFMDHNQETSLTLKLVMHKIGFVAVIIIINKDK